MALACGGKNKFLIKKFNDHLLASLTNELIIRDLWKKIYVCREFIHLVHMFTQSNIRTILFFVINYFLMRGRIPIFFEFFFLNEDNFIFIIWWAYVLDLIIMYSLVFLICFYDFWITHERCAEFSMGINIAPTHP